MKDTRINAFGLLLLLDAVVAIVMLATDKNLQTNFGAQSPYFVHWYGVLAMALVDLLLAVALLACASVPMLKRIPPSGRRGVVIGALAWTVIGILASVGIVSSYMEVGFSSMNQFAQYLFGVTPYPGALSYIPGLYDLLLVLYVVTAIVGALALRRTPSAPSASATS
jgi:hypothetical protein